MNYIAQESELNAGLRAEKPYRGRNSAIPLADRQPQFPPAAKISAWTQSLTRALAFAEDRQARMIGIAGISGGASAGVAPSLAQIYSEFGKRVLLVDARGVKPSDKAAVLVDSIPDLSALSTPVTNQLCRVDLADPHMTLPASSDFFRYAFERALTQFHAIVVDLPSPAGEAGRPAPAFLAVGPACNLLFLVCVTGRTTRSEIERSLASCKISGANIEGILLNDFQLPASSLLSER